MGKKLESINSSLQEFIAKQYLFFVGTAGNDTKVNVSPKGMDTLRVLSPNRVIWLNLTGSGNETAAHILEQDRMTIMFCSFDKNPLILRLYGRATFCQPGDEDWDELIEHFPNLNGARQIFDLTVDLVQTSCGFGVPEFTLKEQRDTLVKWADGKGDDGIKAYWEEKNQYSLDGKSTGIRFE